MLPYWKSRSVASTLVAGDEVLICGQLGVGIYDKEEKSPLQNGRLTLSSYHVFFQEEGQSEVLCLELGLICPPAVRYKGLGWSHPKIICTLYSGFYFKFSFRSGGMDAFFAALCDALDKKHWSLAKLALQPPVTSAQSSGVVPPPSETNESPFTFTERAGIAGVLRQQPQREDLAEALNDINAVMINAGALVAAIRKFKSQAGVSQEDATAILSIEEALGLGSVVTTRSIGRGGRWHEEVAREVCRWLSVDANPLSRAVVIPLVELFSQYNRARRQELVSPHDLLEACRLISNVMPSSRLSLKVFRSGAKALMNDSAGNVQSLLEKALGARPTRETLLDLRLSLRGVSSSQFSVLLNTSDNIAAEVLEDFEEDEVLCRAESTFGEVTYFWNAFAHCS